MSQPATSTTVQRPMYASSGISAAVSPPSATWRNPSACVPACTLVSSAATLTLSAVVAPHRPRHVHCLVARPHGRAVAQRLAYVEDPHQHGSIADIAGARQPRAGRSNHWTATPRRATLMDMTVLTVDPTAPDPATLARAADVLRRGGLVAFPTETVYGLGANALDEAAVRRIFAAKGRPSYNPLIVHVPDAGAARTVVRAWPAAAVAQPPRSGPAR
jgi:hypothetical protein